jgi:hypothetical protein
MSQQHQPQSLSGGMMYEPFQQAEMHCDVDRQMQPGGAEGEEEGGEHDQDQDARSDHSSAQSKVGTKYPISCQIIGYLRSCNFDGL